MENNKNKADIVAKLNETVKPVIAWSAVGGTLVVAIALALIFWL